LCRRRRINRSGWLPKQPCCGDCKRVVKKYAPVRRHSSGAGHESRTRAATIISCSLLIIAGSAPEKASAGAQCNWSHRRRHCLASLLERDRNCVAGGGGGRSGLKEDNEPGANKAHDDESNKLAGGQAGGWADKRTDGRAKKNHRSAAMTTRGGGPLEGASGRRLAALVVGLFRAPGHRPDTLTGRAGRAPIRPIGIPSA
jgi:hypothetical protein